MNSQASAPQLSTAERLAAIRKEWEAAQERFQAQMGSASGSGTGESYRVGEVMDLFHPMDLGLCAVVLAVPFLQPIPMSGLSSIMGFLLIVLSGFRVFGKSGAHLPRFLSDKKIPLVLLLKLVKAAEKCISLFSWIPSFPVPVLLRPVIHARVAAMAIAFLALLLSLPLPIPFTNSAPAWGIFVLGLGILEDNSLLYCLGLLILILNVLLFGFLFWGAFALLSSKGFHALFSVDGLNHLSEQLKNLLRS